MKTTSSVRASADQRGSLALRSFVLAVCLFACVQPSWAQTSSPIPATAYEWSRPFVIGVDAAGRPLECGTVLDDSRAIARVASSAVGLPPQTRSWEMIPGVVRGDGRETFRLEVNANGPVQSVVLSYLSGLVVAPGAAPLQLKDDGVGADRLAGDRIFTAGPFTINPTNLHFHLERYGSESSAANLSNQTFLTIGGITVTEPGGTEWRFVIDPDVGVLSTNVGAALSEQIAPNVSISPHLANVVTDFAGAQTFLRYREGDDRLPRITEPLFRALAQKPDFVLLFSTHHIERVDGARNFVAGTHLTVKRNYTGTGAPLLDQTARYGSNERLLSINVLDAGFRGINADAATHELLHQWGAYLSFSLRLGDGVHYYNWTSIQSLLGGFPWIDLGNGTFRRNCNGDGANGAHQIAPLDKYMMGLINPAQVAPLRWEAVSLPNPINCDNVITGENGVVTIQDIVNSAGARSPGPAQAQRDFRIGFVVESQGRFLNSNEMTFYERLAEHYTRSLPANSPLPFVAGNWVPIAKYFGEDTGWSSSIGDVRLRIERLSTTILLLSVEDVFSTVSYRMESADRPDALTWNFQGTLLNSGSVLPVTNRGGKGFFRAVRLDGTSSPVTR